MVRNCEKLETDKSIMDVKCKKTAIFDSIVSHTDAENPASSFSARELNSMFVEQLHMHGIQHNTFYRKVSEKFT